MSPDLPRREVLRGALAAVTSPLVLGACTADLYRRGAGSVSPSGSARTPVAPAGAARAVRFQGRMVAVPERATRVVTLGDACLQPSLDLGAPVVATASVAPALVPPSRRQALRELPVVGSGRGSDPLTAEDVLAHDPDLVLVSDRASQELVGEIGGVVSVVVVQTSGTYRRDWRGRIRELADVLGVDTFATVDAAYRAHAARIRRDRARIPMAAPVVILRAWDRARLTAYGPESVVGRIYADAGARFVPAVRPGAPGEDPTAPGEFGAPLTDVERLVEGARLVMLASDYAGGLDAFTGGALAGSLEMKTFVREHDMVMRGAGVLGVTNYAQAAYLLDQLDAALAAAGA